MKMSGVASANEERYVLAERFTPHVYAIPYIFHIRGSLDGDRLECAVRRVCNRHPAFRTGFQISAQRNVIKYWLPDRTITLERISAPGLALSAVRELLYPRVFAKPDLTPASLSSFYLVQVADDEHYFGFSHHHSISDGQSLQIFVREVFAEYSSDNKLEASQPAAPFFDEDWRGREEYLEAQKFWTQALQMEGPQARLAEDVSLTDRPSKQGTVSIQLEHKLLDKVSSAVRQLGVSEFTFFYAVTLIMLSRQAGASSICTSFQSDGRRGIPGAENLIASLSNTLPLVIDVNEKQKFSEFVKFLRNSIKSALKHQSFPYHHIIEKTAAHPRFGFNWYPELPEIVLPNLSVSLTEMLDRQSDYDLNFRFVRRAGHASLLLYHSGGISAARARQIADGLLVLAEAFADQPTMVMASASTMHGEQAFLPDWGIALEPRKNGKIHEAFEQRAAIQPDSVAITYGLESFSYADVAKRMKALGLALQRNGLGKGSRVLIVADREPALIWTMLAVARIGAIFIVLDSAYPEERMEVLARLAAPHIVLANRGNASWDRASRIADLLGLPTYDIEKIDCSDDCPDPDVVINPEDPAYFLFTTGSTGVPKCVSCSHDPLVHFVRWQAENFSFNADDRFTMLSGLSHDPLLRDIFTPLSIGASIIIPESEDVMLKPGHLAQWFDKHRPTVTHITPPLAQILIAKTPQPIVVPSLRNAFMGGDILRPELAQALVKFAPNVKVVNFYGSTETPQAASYFLWDDDMSKITVPIGRGSDGFQIGVLDRYGRLCGPGAQGEIAVRSRYLSQGYVQAGIIDLSPADRGLDSHGEATIYRTGDRGYYLEDGNVMLIGREDDQIKIRGYRVNLAEVTAVLLNRPEVSAAIALATGDEGNRQIIGFVSGSPHLGDGSALLDDLLNEVPSYMVPSRVVVLDSIPLLPNGKIDRNLLNEYAMQKPEAAGKGHRPKTATEKSIAAV